MTVTCYNMKGEPIPLEEAMEQWKGDSDARRVAFTRLPNGYTVSTVLLSFDHNWNGGKPIIFETMVFGPYTGGCEQDMARYCTHEEALKGHDKMVRKVRKWPAQEKPNE